MKVVIYFFKYITWPNLSPDIMGYMILWVEITHGKSPPSHVWCQLVHFNWRYNVFNLLRDLIKPCTWSMMWLYQWHSLLHVITLSVLVAIGIVAVEVEWFKVLTWSRKTPWLKSNIILWVGTLMVSHHPVTKFGAHWHFGWGQKMVLVCHVIPQDYVIKWSHDFMSRSPYDLDYKFMWLYGL